MTKRSCMWGNKELLFEGLLAGQLGWVDMS